MSTMLNLNARSETVSRILELRVDRDEEVSICTNALLKKSHNVLLYGERGTGKTFLTSLVHEEIAKRDRSVFPVTVVLSSLQAYSRNDEASAFPRAILLQICSDLWKRLLGKSYLDLRERLNETGNEITLRNKAEKTIQRIYTNLMISTKKSRHEWLNSVGFSAGAKGEKRESGFIEQEQANLLPFEFLEFMDEINSCVLSEYGMKKIVLLCDEANTLPLFSQHEVLERHLELFATKQLQFLFVAGFMPVEPINNLPTSFETILELRGFNQLCFIEELIRKIHCDTSIAFSEKAIEVLFRAFHGHPRRTLYAYQNVLTNALEKRQTEITDQIMKRCCTILKKREKKPGNVMGICT